MSARNTDTIRLTPASTYARFAPYVQRRLAGFGVRDADLPDLCHEVFLVVHGKRHLLPAVGRIDLWLREICRRVAAGYRRRAGHQLEVLGCDADEHADLAADAARGARRRAQALPPAPGAEPPRRRIARSARPSRRRRDAAQRARQAGRARSQDGPQPAGARAASGVALAVRRSAEPRGPAPRCGSRRPAHRSCAIRRHAGAPSAPRRSELEILRVSPEHCSGVLGNVTVSDWRGPQIEAATIEAVIGQAPYTLEKCGGEIAYLALIEPTVLPPTFEARQKIVDAMEIVGPYFNSFAVVLLGDERAHQSADPRGPHAARPTALPAALLFLGERGGRVAVRGSRARPRGAARSRPARRRRRRPAAARGRAPRRTPPRPIVRASSAPDRRQRFHQATPHAFM